MTYGIALQTVVWNSGGQHEYLPIYSVKLKSAAGACQLLNRSLCFVAKYYRNTTVQHSTHAATMRATQHSVTDRQTDDSITPIADHTG